MTMQALFSMMGIYPDDATSPIYTITKPVFDKVTIHLDKRFYKNDKIVIENKTKKRYIRSIKLGKKRVKSYQINHNDLIKAGKLMIK